MNRLLYLKTKKEKKRYVRFVSGIYRGCEKSRDSLSRLLAGVLLNTSCFCETALILPVAVVDDAGDIFCAATLIVADNLPDVLQISFLEMAPGGEEAFPLILKAARKAAAERNIESIVAGLNGHVNYGMGFLADNFDLPQSFGAPYNAPSYIDVLEKNGGVADRQVSFLIDMSTFREMWLPLLEKRIHPTVTCRVVDFKKIEAEIRLYTDLNNEIFRDHKLYYRRRYEEDLELFREFSLLLRNENFIVAEEGGRPIGFLLWYPDFNELISEGSSMGLATVIKYRLLKKPVRRFKIAEIGILSEYRGKGVSWALLKKCADLTMGRFETCETSWIFDDNLRSRGLAETWEGANGKAVKLHKQYSVYYFEP